MAKKRISNINDEIDIKLFFYITRKSLIYVMLFMGIGLAGAYFYLRYTYQVYSASATIQINSNDDNVNKILETQSIITEQQNDLDKYRELISSSVFLGQVFAKLPLDISYFNEGRILSIEQYKCSPYEVEATITNNLIYGVPIYIVFSSKDKFEISYSLPDSGKFKKEFKVSEKAVLPWGVIKIKIVDPAKLQLNEGILDQNSYYFILNNPDNIVTTYSAELTVAIVNAVAKTIQITVNDRNPQKAYDLVSTIVSEYKTYGVAKKSESANSVLAFIDKQLKVVYDTLFKSEVDLDNFKRDNKLDSTNMEPLPSVYTRINEFENQLLKIELEETLLDEIDVALKDKDLDIYKLIATIAGSEFETTITGFLTSLKDLLTKKEALLYEVTKNSSQITAIDYQIGIEKKLLTESILTLKANLKSRKTKINTFLDNYQGTAFSAKNKYNALELSSLQRMYKINEEFYNKLIDKKAEYQISKAGYVSEIVTLDISSVPTVPISPRKRMVYFGCFLVAFMLSFGLILFKYLFFNSITNINDIVKYTDASVLGIIPKYKKEIPVSQLIVDKRPKSLIAESLRSIRTNLQFISNEPGPKVIAITSTISGEGKTFVAINLAGVIAFSEKRVIVMDFDLRKPKIHVGFGAENKKGISTILMGLDNADDCIQHSSIERLDFITAGPVPPNPSELMLNKRMPDLIEHLKKSYDYVVIDNPPIGIVTDGMRCMLLADYPLYIFKANHSKRIFVENVDRLITENGITKLALVLNSVESQYSGYSYTKSSSSGSYGYGYGYAYAYGYGYGYYDEDYLKPVKKKFILDRISDWIMKKVFRRD